MIFESLICQLQNILEIKNSPYVIFIIRFKVKNIISFKKIIGKKTFKLDKLW